MNALILHARAFSFTGRDGGNVSGKDVWYLEEMDPISDPNESGLPPCKVAANDQAFEEIVKAKLPGIFSVELGRRPGARNKPESVIKSAKLLRPVPVEGLLGLGK